MAPAKARTEVEPPDLPDALDEVAAPPLENGVNWSGIATAVDGSEATVADLELREVRWASARLTGIRLPGVRCRDVEFVDCDLAGAVLDSGHLTRVQFTRCRVTGLVLAGSNLIDVAFHDCRADLANLRMAVGKRVRFSDCNLREADFYAAQLDQLRLYDCDVTGIELSQALLVGVRLNGSRLAQLRGVMALRGAVIDSDQQLPLGQELLSAAGVRVDDARP